MTNPRKADIKKYESMAPKRPSKKALKRQHDAIWEDLEPLLVERMECGENQPSAHLTMRCKAWDVKANNAGINKTFDVLFAKFQVRMMQRAFAEMERQLYKETRDLLMYGEALGPESGLRAFIVDSGENGKEFAASAFSLPIKPISPIMSLMAKGV